MKGPLALLVCLPLIIWLWRRDQQARPRCSPALWLPILWLLVLGSRPLSFWLGIGGSSALEGNSFDAALYLIQIFASVCVISKRGINAGFIIQQNKALMLFYLLLFATVIWSAYPWPTFKRCFKEVGGVFVLLVVLSEENPVEAIKAVFARCAYVLFPLSVICIKFFPSIGRQYSNSGGTMYSGVTMQKNSLGEIALVCGLVLLAELMQTNRPSESGRGRGHHFTIGFTLAIGLWLLVVSSSKTALICFLFGGIIVTSSKLPLLKGYPFRTAALFLAGVPLFFIADSIFHISEYLLSLIGRDSTFTTRTDVWQAVKDNPPNALLGSGYMMYWDLQRDIQIGNFTVAGWRSAHNGYIEVFLDGGLPAIGLLAVLLLVVGWRTVREFFTGSEYGRLAFGFLIVNLCYNLSESMFARRSPIWFAFLLFTLNYRRVVFDEAGKREMRSESLPVVA